MNSKDKKKTKKKGKIFRLRYFIYDLVKWTGALSTLIALRPRLIYISKAAKKRVKGAALVIANHQSYLDCIKLHMAFWYRRLHFVATKQLFEGKFRNWFFHKALCIPVDKENFNFQTFRDVCACLEEGGVVGVFPEGGMNGQEGTVKAFKAGVVLMALKSGAPIIPVYLAKPKHWYNMQKIVIGEPIGLENGGKMPTLQDVEKMAEILRTKEIELMEKLEK